MLLQASNVIPTMLSDALTALIAGVYINRQQLLCNHLLVE